MTEVIKTAINWRDVMAQWQMSGLPKKVFCDEQQLNYKTFLKNCQRQAALQPVAEVVENRATAVPTFIPVQLKSSADKTALPPLSLILSKRFTLEVPVESAQAPVLKALFKALGVVA